MEATAPVGLHGVLTITARVRSVIAAMSGCARIAKPSSAAIATVTASAPASRTWAGMLTQAGVCTTASSPGERNARASWYRAALAPTVTSVLAALHGAPWAQ